MPVPPPPLQQLQRSRHRSQLDKGTLYSLLSVLALHSAAMHSMLQPFHVPIFLSVHIPLGGPFKPVHLSGTCNTAGSFILTTLTHPHTHRRRRQPHFCGSFVLTRTFRASSVRSTAHPHHGHFIDPRRIICTPHRWGAFLGLTVRADFRRLPRALGHSASLRLHHARRSLRAGVSGRYPIIPPVGISVL